MDVVPANVPVDTDRNVFSAHHTLGINHLQASSGSHNHDGVNSVPVLDGVAITGSRSGGAALVSIIAALVKLGAVDSSVA